MIVGAVTIPGAGEMDRDEGFKPQSASEKPKQKQPRKAKRFGLWMINGKPAGVKRCVVVRDMISV